MKVAFIGSFGVGKTILASKLHSIMGSQSEYLDEIPRWLVKNRFLSAAEFKQMKTTSPLNVPYILGLATVFYENIINTNADTLIIDWHLIIVKSYFDFFLKKDNEPNQCSLVELERLIDKLLKYYLAAIDISFYLPINKIPLVQDDLREQNKEKQVLIDGFLQYYIHHWSVPNCILIENISIEGRIDEIKNAISLKIPSFFLV